MKYVYPAVFTVEEGGGYSINFPDLEGCYTCGDDLPDSLKMAEDALAFTLFNCEREGKIIPPASDIRLLEVEANEFVNYIVCDTLVYRKMHNNKAVKKTLTIPEWLNEEAMEKEINFSAVLTEALKDRLGLE